MGDSVGGEVLARSLEGRLQFDITQRVLTNGSIYIDMAHLTVERSASSGSPSRQSPGRSPPPAGTVTGSM